MSNIILADFPFQFSWDENDCSLENIKAYMLLESDSFIANIIKAAGISTNDQIRQLLNSKSIDRFKIIIDSFVRDLPDTISDIKNLRDDFLIQEWILLGAITENILQIFLSVYLRDYKNSKWKLWDNFNSSFKDDIFLFIDGELKKGIITQEQSKSFKNAVKNKIKEHTQKPEVDKLMLDSLIQFYTDEHIIDKEFIAELKIIQMNRNCVHLFLNRNISDIKQLVHSIYFMGRLINELNYRLPTYGDNEK